ncbi:unnamed protein product, partial [marine sediment metagenome]
MNWYKQAQLEIIDQRGNLEDSSPEYRHYTQVAHDLYHGEEPVEKPNILWILVNGAIDVEEEIRGRNAHGLVDRWDRLYDVYYGRYSPTEKVISVASPEYGVRSLASIPSGLISLLKQ